MVKRITFGLATALLLFVMSGMAEATRYSEDFEDFSSWESGWLGINTNIQNYYGEAKRGNNPDGLWIADGLNNGQKITEIYFDKLFGNSITAFSIDITTFVKNAKAIFELFDISGNLIFSSPITSYSGYFTDPGSYQTFSLTSLNGISGFTISGGVIEGNTSIDNVFITTGASAAGVSAVPEPNSFLLFSVAIAGLAGAGLKKKKN